MNVLWNHRQERRACVATPHGRWRYALLAFSMFWVASCTLFHPGLQREEEVRSKLTCVDIGEGTPWQNVTALWGEPQQMIPGAKVDLTKGPFVRRYDGRTLLVTSESKLVEDANGKRQYSEIIIKVEACKER